MAYLQVFPHVAKNWKHGPGMVSDDVNTGLAGFDEVIESSLNWKFKPCGNHPPARYVSCVSPQRSRSNITFVNQLQIQPQSGRIELFR